MRYRIGTVQAETGYASTSDIVTLIAWVTLLIGIGFVVVGLHGRPRWLGAWGVSHRLD